MKNIICTIILISTIQFGYSFGGIGVYGVSDLGKIAGVSESVDFSETNIDNNITREEGTSSLGLGCYFYLDVIPVVDIEIGGDIVFSTYDFEYSYQYTSNTLFEDIVPGTLVWAKTSYYVSVQKPIFKVPMFKLYGGLGYKNANSLPLMSNDFLSSLMENGADIDKIDDGDTLTDTIKDQIKSQGGLMIETGARFKPVFLPFSLNVKIQHNFIKDVVPNKDSYTTILFGLGLAL